MALWRSIRLRVIGSGGRRGTTSDCWRRWCWIAWTWSWSSHGWMSMFATLPLTTALFVNRVVNMAMIPVQPLLDRLAEIPYMARGSKRLVVVMGQLGDFDSINCGGPLSAWTEGAVPRPWPISVCPTPRVHQRVRYRSSMSSMWLPALQGASVIGPVAPTYRTLNRRRESSSG